MVATPPRAPALALSEADTRPIAPGTALQKLHSGRYRLEDLLGTGGTGSVYAAFDTILGRRVAIKTLRSAAAAPGVLAREARVLASIQHPNVVTVHALHEADDPPFLVMEWIDGDPLSTVLRTRRPTLAEALLMLRRIADGLDAIHEAGLVHGDIKPANVLVGRNGRLAIVDVGLVPRLERMSAGEVLGTLPYMPPERASGTIIPPGLAPRSDVFSFALLAFEVLAGRRPFAGELAGVKGSGPARTGARTLPRVFDQPLARGTSDVPTRRHASAGKLVDALVLAAESLDTAGHPLRVLVADEDAGSRARLSAALAARLRGVVVETVSSSAAALASIVDSPPSVIVLGVAVAEAGGTELLASVRRAAPALPVIICLSLGTACEGPRVAELGAHSLLFKPIIVDELARAIHVAMSGAKESERRRPG